MRRPSEASAVLCKATISGETIIGKGRSMSLGKGEGCSIDKESFGEFEDPRFRIH